LESILERALILHPSDPIRFDHLLKGKSPKPAFPSKDYHQELPTFQKLARDYFRGVLIQPAGRINGPGGAAELTGLNPSTLRNKLIKLGLVVGWVRAAYPTVDFSAWVTSYPSYKTKHTQLFILVRQVKVI
jgi:hypothetical protein